VGHELGPIEGLSTLEHCIDGASEMRGEDRECLALAVFFCQPLDIALSLGITAQEQHRRFAEGSLQMHVADLLADVPEHFAGRALLALHQPGVGEKLLHPGEAADVLDLVEQHQGEDAPHARDRAQQMIGVGILAFGHEVEIEPSPKIAGGGLNQYQLDAANAGKIKCHF